MTTQTIDVTGLPEGWKAVAYRVPKGNIEFVLIENVVREAKPQDKKCLIVEKIQPRRIVLEETDESNAKFQDAWCTQHFINGVILTQQPKKWREVKGTDDPLTNAEPKLGLSVDECKYVLGRNGKYAGNVFDKMGKFIKENL